jgi:hypothetical protein
VEVQPLSVSCLSGGVVHTASAAQHSAQQHATATATQAVQTVYALLCCTVTVRLHITTSQNFSHELMYLCTLCLLLLQAPGTSVSVTGSSPGPSTSSSSPAPCTPVYVTAPYTNVQVQVRARNRIARVCDVRSGHLETRLVAFTRTIVSPLLAVSAAQSYAQLQP